jgi:hypothetical protein
MSGILAAACCCDQPQVCLRKRPIRINMRYQAALRNHYLLSSAVLINSAEYPPCPDPSLICTAPAVSDCVFVCDFPDHPCTPNTGEMQVITNFDSGNIEVTLPYISTTLVSQAFQPGCGWKVDLGSGPVDSGLQYTGQREQDTNSTTIRFEENNANLAGCSTMIQSEEGDQVFYMEIRYGWRCLYFSPPAHFAIRRQPFQPQYNGWTWEIQGSVFRVRNTAGAVQSTINLAGLTLLQAQQQINALPSVETVRLFGNIPADSMPATLIEDIPATVLDNNFAQSVFLFAPLSREVEWYQHGAFGPYWQSFTRVGGAGGPIVAEGFYRLKYGCDPGDPRDYALGTDPASEFLFCQGICTSLLNWQDAYDPRVGFLEPNFGGYGGKFASGLGLNNLVWSCSDFPITESTAYAAFVAGTMPRVRWCDQYEPIGVSWAWYPGAFGDKAVALGTAAQVFWSDASNISPTEYNSIGPDTDTDFCDCTVGPSNFTRCYLEERCTSWRTAKQYCMTRL